MENVVYDNETNIIDYADAKAALATTPANEKKQAPTVAQLKSMLERTMDGLANAPDAQALKEHAAAIKVLESRVISNTLQSRFGLPGAQATCAAEIIEIGYRLTECKRIIAGRNWSAWLNKCGCLAAFARKDMLVYEWFARCICINDTIGSGSGAVFNLEVDIDHLHKLADPSTPEAARAEVVRRAGEKLDYADVVAIIRKAKAKERKGGKRRAVVGVNEIAAGS
jgi:hypothetical protein